jgi:hypothetical protein
MEEEARKIAELLEKRHDQQVTTEMVQVHMARKIIDSLPKSEL